MTPLSSFTSAAFSASHVTALAIDGNSLLAASVSEKDGEYTVHALRTIELPLLVERIERVPHPIFLDVNCLRYPGADEIKAGFTEILAEPVFRNPVIGVFPADCVKTHQEKGRDHAGERHGRFAHAVRSSAQSSNPSKYPRVVALQNVPAGKGQEWTRVWSGRVADLFACTDQYRSLGISFLGVVTGKRALAEVTRCIGPEADGVALTLVDVGKLRSVYVGSRKGHVEFTHSIPVGLARDDAHYFSKLPPRMSDVQHLSDEGISLLLPPDATPSPLFEPEAETAQIDCTRLGLQIARFASRVTQEIWPESVQYHGPVRLCFTGLPSHVEGLARYVSAASGIPMRVFGETSIPGIHLADGIRWGDAANHLQPIGAAISWFRRETSRFGMVIRDRRPVSVRSVDSQIGEWQDNTIYIIESPPQGGSGIVPRI